jgi:hypothetical protein
VLVVENHEPPDPVDVSRFGAKRQVLDANSLSDEPRIATLSNAWTALMLMRRRPASRYWSSECLINNGGQIAACDAHVLLS